MCHTVFLGSSRPLCFCAPKISQNTLYTVILALYSHALSVFRPRIELSCRVIIVMKNWLICDRCASLFFPTKTLSKDPYLKSFISRVRTKHRERFSSFSRYCTRRVVTTYFLSSLQCNDGTIAVKMNDEVQKS